MEQKYSFLLSLPHLSFNEMGNVEATGNLDVTFLTAVMLSFRFGPVSKLLTSGAPVLLVFSAVVL